MCVNPCVNKALLTYLLLLIGITVVGVVWRILVMDFVKGSWRGEQNGQGGDDVGDMAQVMTNSSFYLLNYA